MFFYLLRFTFHIVFFPSIVLVGTLIIFVANRLDKHQISTNPTGLACRW